MRTESVSGYRRRLDHRIRHDVGGQGHDRERYCRGYGDITAAGGVVVIDDGFVAIERNGIPDLPKGHIEKGESPEVAAVREVEEETGITDLEIIKELPATWHCYLLQNQWTIKKTSWYLMHTNSGMKNVPQTEEGISNVYLVNQDEIKNFEEKTFASLRFLVKNIFPFV